MSLRRGKPNVQRAKEIAESGKVAGVAAVSTVGRIIDGDTFTIDSGDTRRIRLQGIDCPELSTPEGKAAADAVKNILHPGDVVRLTNVEIQSGSDVYRNERIVALVQKGNILINEEIVRQGWAVPTEHLYKVPTTEATKIRNALEDAKRMKRGLWKKFPSSNFLKPYDLITDITDFPEIDNLERFSKIPGATRIGTVWLYVPPTQINVTEHNVNQEIPLVRAPGSARLKTNQAEQRIEIYAIFPNRWSVNYQFRPILAQFIRSPFLPLKNEHVEDLLLPSYAVPDDYLASEAPGEEQKKREELKKLFEDNAKYGSKVTDLQGRMMDAVGSNSRSVPVKIRDRQLFVALRNMVVSTVPGKPQGLQVTFVLSAFNYLPHVNRVEYLKTMGDVVKQARYFEELGKLRFPDGDPKELDALRSGIGSTSDISKSEPFKRYYRTLLAEGNIPELDSHLVWNQTITPRLLPFQQERLDDISMKIDANLLSNSIVRENQLQIRQLSEEIELLLLDEIKSPGSPLQQMVGSISNVSDMFFNFMAHGIGDAIKNADTLLNNRDVLAISVGKWLDANLADLPSSIKNHPVMRDTTGMELFKDACGRVLRNPNILKMMAAVLKRERENAYGSKFPITVKLSTGPRTVIASVSASYSPLVVPVGTLDHPIPSMQFFGKSDWVISVNVQTCDKGLVERIMDLFQKSRMNKMSQGDRDNWFLSRLNAVDVGLNDLRSNGFFTALGINKVLLDDFTNETVQGKPGWWNLTLRFVQADLSVSEWEKLVPTNVASNLAQKQILRNIRDNGVPTGSAVGKEIKDTLDQSSRNIVLAAFEGIFESPISDKELDDLTKNGEIQGAFISNMDNPEGWRKVFEDIFLKDVAQVRLGPYSLVKDPGIAVSGMEGQLDEFRSYSGYPLLFEERIPFLRTAFRLAMQEVINRKLAGIRSGSADQKKELVSLFDPSASDVENAIERMVQEGQVATGSFLHGCYPDLELPIYTRNPNMISPDFFYRRDERTPSSAVADVQKSLDEMFSAAIRQAQARETGIALPEEVISSVREYIAWKRCGTTVGEELKSSNVTPEEATQLVRNLMPLPTEEEYRKAEDELASQEYSNIPVKDLLAARRLSLLVRIAAVQDQITTAEGAGAQIPSNEQDTIRRKQVDLIEEFNSMGQIINSGAIEGLWGTVTPATLVRNQRYLTQAAKFRVNRARSEEVAGSMARAYPTVKIYFVEEDGREWGLLDDYYSYQSIRSVQVVASKASASKVATIQMTNLTRKLSDQKATLGENVTVDQTSREQNLRSFALREGTTIMVQMGYSNEPRFLERVFLGKVISVSAGEVIQVVAQSFGAEMNGPVFRGEEKKLGYLFSSARSIGDALVLATSSMDGLDHFGSRSWLKLLNLTPEKEASQALARSNPKFRKWSIYKSFLNPFKKLVSLGISDPRLENAYLPYTGNVYSAFGAIWHGTTTPESEMAQKTGFSLKSITNFFKNANFDWYIPPGQTLWKLMQEMSLYYNDYIVTVLPFNDNILGMQRETIYFGPRNGLYKYTEQFDSVETTGDVYNKNESDFALNVTNPDHLVDEDGRPLPGYMPVVNYHWIDSLHDVLENGITASSEKLHNKVTIRYGGEPGQGQGKEFTVVADDNIKEGNIRHLVSQQPNVDPAAFEDVVNTVLKPWSTSVARATTKAAVATGAAILAPLPGVEVGAYLKTPSKWTTRLDDVPLPAKYTVSTNLLTKEMSKMYGGLLRMWGRPSLKPYDVLYLNDATNMMFGPVEVDEVVHDFNAETGFTTTVTPSAIVNSRNQTQVYHDIALNGISLPWEYLAKSVGIVAGKNTVAKFGSTALVVGGSAAISPHVRTALTYVFRMITGGASNLLRLGGVGAGASAGALTSTTAIVGGSAVAATAGLAMAYGAGVLWEKGVCKVMGRDIISITGLFYNGAPFIAGMEGAYKNSFKAWIRDKVSTALTVSIGQETFGIPLSPR